MASIIPVRSRVVDEVSKFVLCEERGIVVFYFVKGFYR